MAWPHDPVTSGVNQNSFTLVTHAQLSYSTAVRQREVDGTGTQIIHFVFFAPIGNRKDIVLGHKPRQMRPTGN